MSKMTIPSSSQIPCGHLSNFVTSSSQTTKYYSQIHAHFLKSNPTVFQINNLIKSTPSSKSLFLYRCMLHFTQIRPNNYTYPFLIKPVSHSSHCYMLHTHIIKTGFETDPYVQSSLIHVYSSISKDLNYAHKVFEKTSVKEPVCWNAMIDGYVKAGEILHAKSIFDSMMSKDIVSWNTMINGYALLGRLEEALCLFDTMPAKNLVSWNSMLAGYNKCGNLEGARMIFENMPCRDYISWNTMLACYAHNARWDESFKLFEKMQCSSVKATDATFVSMLSVCAQLGALDKGKWLHRLIEKNNIKLNVVLSTALVDMYAKCGDVSRAYEIFYAIEDKDVLAWNAIIVGVSVHGKALEVIQLLEEMMESGSKPDDITFVAVLSACSHAGMLMEGREFLSCMKKVYGVVPKVEHYGCVIDLLARKGMLEEAESLVKLMPMEPNAPAWGSILGGCRIYGNSDAADRIGKQLLSLQPKKSGRYVLLYNIYASTNRWEDAGKIRKMMSTKKITKTPGTSMIELNGIINNFVSGDKSHPESENIHLKLLEVLEQLKIKEGYNPDVKQVLVDVEEEEKEHLVSVHSEKLAVAFGLLHTEYGDTIRIIKNLRVCRDCHEMIKLVSKFYGREIVMRDRNRFHLFKGGACSCRDYW